MKIGIYVPVFESKPGGLGTYTREITRRLIDRFESVVLYTTTPSDVPSNWNAEVVGLPRTRLNRTVDRRAMRTIWLNSNVRNDLKRRGLEALFSPTHEGMISSSVPQVIVVHDLTSFVVPSSYFTKLKTNYLKLIFPRVLRSSSNVIAVSRNTRNDLVNYFGLNADSIDVVYEGYDSSTFFPRSEAEVANLLRRYQLQKPYLLYSGTFAAHKNTIFLADVVRAVHARGLDLELVLTGRLDVGEFAATRRRLEQYRLWQHTRPLGYVTYEELSTLMQGAHAFAFPSLYEGFGLAPLEAMASGAAVISSDRASLPEVIGRGGLMADPHDALKWTEHILSLANHTCNAAQRAAAISNAARFRWDDAADQLMMIIRNAAEQTARTIRTK